MRILLLSAASSVHTQRWANAFVQRGHEVHLVSQHVPLKDYDHRVQMHALPHYAGLGYLSNVKRLQGAVHALKPDVVNAHYATGYGTLSRAVENVPLVLNVWGSDVYDFPEKSAFHRWLLRQNLRRADRVISTSEAMARRTQLVCPGLSAPIVVPFGVETTAFHPSGRTRSNGPVVIGTVKTLAQKYGIDTLIEAFALLTKRADMPPISLRIVGGGPERDKLEALAKEHGVLDRTIFAGAVPHDQVPDQLRELDVYVALSRLDSESFGVAAIEASACGLPVVVSDVDGLKEVTMHGRTGLVVPRNDPGAAAEALAQLVLSADLRARMGEAGVAHVRGKYEWSACVDRMLNVLTEASRSKG